MDLKRFKEKLKEQGIKLAEFRKLSGLKSAKDFRDYIAMTEDFEDALGYAFIWGDTKEGWAYWYLKSQCLSERHKEEIFGLLVEELGYEVEEDY